MPDLYSAHYNPDVLSCLANLSNDEVFTPPQIANAMLDLLPQELFRDPNTKFLDPATKTGVFLREIARRLIVGLADQIPDLQVRLNHIFHEQIYGIAMTEITSLLSRRSLYCSKYPNGRYSVNHFDSIQGNVRFKNTQHRWKNGRCVFCGASEGRYQRDAGLETYAYEFIHTIHPEEIWNMKFDVIIGNPPYQLNDGGNNASAVPIYQKFVEQAKRLKPRYLSMIIPDRWFAGGRGLDKFREGMLNDKHISVLYDYANADECFPGVDVSGGICYFLWDKSYSGPCKMTNISSGKEHTAYRDLNQFPILIRSNTAVSIVEKVVALNDQPLSKYASSQKPFGLRTYARPDEKGELVLRWNGGRGPIQREKVTTGYDMIDKWKVIVSRVFFEHAGKTDKDGKYRVLSVLEMLAPKEVCSETYVVVNSYDEEEKARNLYDYLKTKFARFMILQATSSIMITKGSYVFLPIQDFSKPWTDADLYAKYGLTDEEIAFIESTIKPME